ncbi:MAG: mechanosensitive ion channel family protein, partial [Litorimonas sp.]
MDLNALMNEKLPELQAWALSFGPKLIAAFLIFIIGRIIVRKLSGATVKASQKLPNLDITIAKFLGSIVLFGGLFAVVIASLSALSIPLGFIATIVGAMVLALGFALKGSLGDMASGVMLAFFRP